MPHLPVLRAISCRTGGTNEQALDDRRGHGRRLFDLEKIGLHMQPSGEKMKLLKRLREPSTMAGLSALALLFGLPAGMFDAVAQIVSGAAALAAIALPESK